LGVLCWGLGLCVGGCFLGGDWLVVGCGVFWGGCLVEWVLWFFLVLVVGLLLYWCGVVAVVCFFVFCWCGFVFVWFGFCCGGAFWLCSFGWSLGFGLVGVGFGVGCVFFGLCFFLFWWFGLEWVGGLVLSLLGHGFWCLALVVWLVLMVARGVGWFDWFCFGGWWWLCWVVGGGGCVGVGFGVVLGCCLGVGGEVVGGVGCGSGVLVLGSLGWLLVAVVGFLFVGG